MAEYRLICVGTGNKLTSPRALRRENSRAYQYPQPGMLHVHGQSETSAKVIELPKRELVSAYPGGPAIQGWGLISIGDTYARVLKVPIEDEGVEQPHEHETVIIPAKDRALDIARFWAAPFPSRNYGALIIKGEFPTEEEIYKAREMRETSAREHLNAIILDQNLAKGGHRAAKRGYGPNDRAWAHEFGVVLPDTVDSLDRVEVSEQRVACPECGEGILPVAKLCKHCGSKFKSNGVPVSVMDLAAAKQPEVGAVA